MCVQLIVNTNCNCNCNSNNHNHIVVGAKSVLTVLIWLSVDQKMAIFHQKITSQSLLGISMCWLIEQLY